MDKLIFIYALSKNTGFRKTDRMLLTNKPALLAFFKQINNEVSMQKVSILKKRVKRSRKYLISSETKKMMIAARRAGRNEQRDLAMILMAHRYGLRTSELIK